MSTMIWNFKFQKPLLCLFPLDNTTTTAAESRWPEESWTRWCLPPISTHQPCVYWDNWLLSHFGRSYYQKWFLKNSCSLLPGDRGSKFWPGNVAGGGRWSEGRIFYSTFPRSQVDDHCWTDQHHLHHHLGYSTVHSLQARLVSQDIHYQHHHYQWYEMILNDIKWY